MLETVMTETEREEMVKRIWDKSREDIEKSVDYAIRSELRMDMSSRSRRIISKEFDDILKPIIEARRETFRAAAEKIVDRIFSGLEQKVLDNLEGNLTYYADSVFDQFGKSLADSMKNSALKFVRDEMSRLRKEAK